MKVFRIGVRLAAVQRTEGNRRAGGRKTQNAMVKAWNEFTSIAKRAKEIPDGIVDEHSLLLYIKYNAERPKRTRRGQEIPGTFVGASHLKKLFFGALRIRKEQDAANPSLVHTRPAVSVIVWDAIKTRMDEALERVRNGLVPNEDAPDIRANTFLSEVTDAQLEKIGQGFLMHRQVRLSVFGHLAWTAQHATGNRGDDFWALKLAELQPHTLLHPDKRTGITSILGLQGEEKAGRRGMRTVVNPSYSVFIANLKPDMCPLGAFAFYLHYLYDEKNIIGSMSINWLINKSWRGIRILHGPNSPTTPFNEQNLYNLYCRAYHHAGFQSRLKAHLARHLLGYKQEALGVDAAETSKLGWVRGETYLDTYALSLPKKAILAAAGYQADEQYDPLWRHVRVPEQFLARICPMAEEIYAQVAGKPNLAGTTNHWLMIMDLRPYFFQCGAAIWQKCPKSAIFRLPGFIGQDVRNWMTTEYPAQLSLLQANAGSPMDLQRIQSTSLRLALEEVRNLLASQSIEFKKMGALLERRTSALSPAQGFSASRYHRNGKSLLYPALVTTNFPAVLLASPDRGHNIPDSPISIHVSADLEETGTYEFEDGSIRAFVNESPKLPQTPRSVAQVDLVLPPVAAFYKKGAITGFIPPVLGQKSARWLDIFPLIHQPKLCWDVWGPDKSLEQFSGLDELWTTYVIGAPVLDTNGTQTGMKPPLKLVEQHFQHKWRTSSEKKRGKIWQRFREIPEWIDCNTTARHVSVDTVMQELEAIRSEGSGESVEPKGLNWLRNELAQRRKDQVHPDLGYSKYFLTVIQAKLTVSTAPTTTTTTTTTVTATAPPTSDPSGSLVSADSIAESMSAPDSVSAPAAALGPAFSLDVPIMADGTQKRKKRAPAIDARRPAKRSKL
ncbi:hypothetical protein B0H10DRAFT_1815675 [Mycena sp. CBHHK59/15]|nr:hypothetical protein B0H10DRAFT_1815675 [Mycena sp. CBHHK59/15]